MYNIIKMKYLFSIFIVCLTIVSIQSKDVTENIGNVLNQLQIGSKTIKEPAIKNVERRRIVDFMVNVIKIRFANWKNHILKIFWLNFRWPVMLLTVLNILNMMMD